MEHPLVLHKLSRMRDRTTPTVLFRQLLREIALLMGYEILRELPLAHETIETPLARMEAPVIAGKKVAFVPILRAGLVMAEGLHGSSRRRAPGISASTATTRRSARSSIS